MSKLSDEAIFGAALRAGFGPTCDYGLDGASETDRELYVEEYPVGEKVLKLCRAIEAATREACGEPAIQQRVEKLEVMTAELFEYFDLEPKGGWRDG